MIVLIFSRVLHFSPTFPILAWELRFVGVVAVCEWCAGSVKEAFSRRERGVRAACSCVRARLLRSCGSVAAVTCCVTTCGLRCSSAGVAWERRGSGAKAAWGLCESGVRAAWERVAAAVWGWRAAWWCGGSLSVSMMWVVWGLHLR